MKNMKALLTKSVIAFIVITGFQCAAAALAPIFIPLIAAKTWTNVSDDNNTFFFRDITDSTNVSPFNGNENLPDGEQASFTGRFENHDIEFTYSSNTDVRRAGKTYKGRVNDASNEITLKGTDATDPLPAITLIAQ